MTTKQTLLQYLESTGAISKEQANAVRVERAKSPNTEEAIIREMRLVDDVTIAKAKSELFSIPYISLKELSIPESILAEVNIDGLKKYRVVPFERGKDYVKMAMVDPFDVQATQVLERKYPLGTKLQVYITTEESIKAILNRRMGDIMSSEVTDALEDVDVPLVEINEDPGLMQSANLQNAPVARIVNSILQYAATSNASDIHIEPMEEKLRVRFRINGIMTERLVLPKSLASAVVSRIKIISNLKIDEKRIPQDGRFPLKVGERKIDLRVSVMPTIYGEKVVMRLLDADTQGIALEDTGIRGKAYKIYMDAMSVTNGIILITGPTGSGKTRTLACSLLKLNDPKVNIISLEDPVEIRVPGVTQIQINNAVGLTFSKGLRSVLRQDPDIVMVGEVRDAETAQLAVQASLTGHLVLSTLHTNSAAAAIPRLLDMGIEPYLLASTLRTVVAQRLPRRICKHCMEAYPASEEVLENIKKTFVSVPNFDVIQYIQRIIEIQKKKGENGSSIMKAPEKGANGEDILYLYRGKGCDRCGGSGYSGRIGIFEVLNITDNISRMMLENISTLDIERTAIESGMLTMVQDGYLKALEGITSIEEVLRVSKE